MVSELVTFGPWYFGTLGLWDLGIYQSTGQCESPVKLRSCYGVEVGGGGLWLVVYLEIATSLLILFLVFDLYIDVEKLGGGGWVHLDYSISSGPFMIMNFEFD